MVMSVFMSHTGRRLQKDCCYAVGHILNWIQFDLGSRPQAHGEFSYDVGNRCGSHYLFGLRLQYGFRCKLLSLEEQQ